MTAERRHAHHKPWVARLFGLLGAVPLIASTIPFSAALAVLALGLRRVGTWPPLLRSVSVAAALGAGVILASALVNGVSVPLVTISQYLVCLLFLLAYRVVTTSLPAAAMTVGWLAAGKLIMIVVLEPELLKGDWTLLLKFGLAYPGTIFLLFLLGKQRTSWSILLLAALGLAGTMWNFRSFGVICMASAVFLLVKIVSKRRVLPVIVLGLVALTAIAVWLPVGISSGIFGRDVQAKAAYQDETGPLFLGGRTESPMSVAAFLARPILGWGNEQSIDRGVIVSGVSIAESWGMGSPDTFLPYWVRAEGRISIHSMFFTGLVEGGVLGAVFPGMLLVLFVWAAVAYNGRYSALVMLVCLSGGWDILFSPWAGTRAVTIASAAFLAGFAILESRKSKRLRNVDGLADQRASDNRRFEVSSS